MENQWENTIRSNFLTYKKEKESLNNKNSFSDLTAEEGT